MFERMFTKVLTMVSTLMIFICAMNIIFQKNIFSEEKKLKTKNILLVLILREAMFPGRLEASPWPWETKTLQLLIFNS